MMEKPPITATTATSTKVTVPQLSRFDRIKAKYKGPQISINTEIETDVGFSYASFSEAVSSVSYSFNRNDVVSGTVVQYDRGGCIVDIGAKASAFLPLGEAALLANGSGSQEGGGKANNIESLISLESNHEFEIISDEDENGQLLTMLHEWAILFDNITRQSTMTNKYTGGGMLVVVWWW